MSDHLDFNTDFLNNAKTSPKSRVDSPKPSGGSGGGKDTLKKWGWGIAIVVGIIFLSSIFDDSGSSSSSTSTYTPPATQATGNNTFTYNGQTFICSDYHYDKAIALRPNATLSTQIDNEASAFETRLNTLKLERTRLDNMYVDEYDQDSLDTYNAAVDSFNYKNNKYKSDVANFTSRTETFDRQIDTYNNYLDANCRPK